nr:hypothetical protein [Actinomycetota bacterium]
MQASLRNSLVLLAVTLAAGSIAAIPKESTRLVADGAAGVGDVGVADSAGSGDAGGDIGGGGDVGGGGSG